MNVGAWQYRRFHVSYGLGFLAAGALLGLVASLHFSSDLSIIIPLLLLAGLLGAIRSRRWYAMAVFAVVGGLFGYYRGSLFHMQVMVYDQFIGRQVQLEGIISNDPQRDEKSRLQFQIGSTSINGHDLPGQVHVSTMSKVGLRRGDHVLLEAKLKPGFGSVQATMSYASVVSYTSPTNLIRDIREKFSAGVHRAMPDPEASLGLGFVVGQRSALPPSLDDQLKIVGLTHIVVASGYNLTILVRLARRLLARRSKYLALVASLLMMLAFLSFSGLSPSMNRAVIVTSMSLFAWYYGRRFHPILLIMYAAAITALINPIYVWADAGWYLSFLAFGGVLVLAPLISNIMFRNKEAPALVQVLIETLSAELVTLPVIAVLFGYFPMFGIVANMLVGVTIPFAMLATTISGIFGMLLPSLAFIAGIPASIIISYTVAVVRILGKVSWAQLTTSMHVWYLVVWYGLLVTGSFITWRKTKYNFRSSSIVD